MPLHLLSDIRYTFRLALRAPLFFCTLIAIVSIGVGAITAMFSIVDALLLRPLPYPKAESIAVVRTRAPWAPSASASLPDFLYWKAQATSFESLAASAYASFGLASEGSRPERVEGANVSGDFFRVLAVHPLRGRLLGPDDDRVAGPRVAVISAAIWQHHFGGRGDIIGKTIALNDVAFTVVGVAPEGFRFGRLNQERVDVWTPLAVSMRNYAEATNSDRGNHFLHVIGRLAPNSNLAQAESQLASIAKTLEQTYPESNAGNGIWIARLQDYLVESSRAGVWILFASVGLVFAIVCANVANLLLTRAQSRRAEMATRAALGGTRARLATQILTETATIFLIASVGGFVLAQLLIEFFSSAVIAPGAVSTIDLHVDFRALAFSVGLCLLCGILCGVVPARAAYRTQPQAVLKESASRAGVSRAQRAIAGGLVVAQVAVAFALLMASGLTLRAFSRVASTPPGFDPHNVATGKISLAPSKCEDHERRLSFFRDASAKVAAQPGAQRVALSSALPMSGSSGYAFAIEGRPPFPPNQAPTLGFYTVTPGYFETIGIPLLRGRNFNDGDRLDARPVIIISQAAADHFFPGEEALGRRIDWGFNDGEWKHVWREVVGIVGNVRSQGLEQPPTADGYVPLAQNTDCLAMTLLARSPQAPALLRALPAAVQALDPNQDIADLKLMSARISGAMSAQRQITTLLGGFAIAGLLLATLGIFGLVSFATSQRTRELGIRIALGATPTQAVRLVLSDGFRLIAIGLAVGAVAAILVGRSLSGRIPQLVAFDVPLYVLIPLLLTVAGLLGCLPPALRAARIPPSTALREV